MKTGGQRSKVHTFVLAAFGSLLLFVLQFSLIAVGPVPDPDWWWGDPEKLRLARLIVMFSLRVLMYAALPCLAAAFVFGWVLSLRHQPGRKGLTSLLLGTWVCVWVACWLNMYLLLGGPDVTRWSTVPLRTPATWYGLVLVGLGLFLGARYKRGA